MGKLHHLPRCRVNKSQPVLDANGIQEILSVPGRIGGGPFHHRHFLEPPGRVAYRIRPVVFLFLKLIICFETWFLGDLQQGKIRRIDEQFSFPQGFFYPFFLVEPDVVDLSAFRFDEFLQFECVIFEIVLIQNRVVVEFNEIMNKIASEAAGAFPEIAD